ncbi:hypothetical protein HBB16_04695 [Pseudonocardia sp. MCCB 268]|nr:hypothetical protein [Pseudonocardia cytotoxica]
MDAVGLLFVGAVLFINGGDAAGLGGHAVRRTDELLRPTLQIVTPTYLIFTANGDADTILAASASTCSRSPTSTSH